MSDNTLTIEASKVTVFVTGCDTNAGLVLGAFTSERAALDELLQAADGSRGDFTEWAENQPGEVTEYDWIEAHQKDDLDTLTHDQFQLNLPPVYAEAPAMLAQLRTLVACNYGHPHGVTVPALDPVRAILARIDGAA